MLRHTLIFCLLFGYGCKTTQNAGNSTVKDVEVSAEVRNDLLKSAQVFQGIDSPSTKTELEIKNGPMPAGAKAGKDYFDWGQTVTCRFAEKNFSKPPSGMSPKFICDILDASGAVASKGVKIKYDPRNPEIYNEPAASRLLWLLGFPADNYYSVKIKCIGCPSKEDVWAFIKRYKTAKPDEQAAMRKTVEDLTAANAVVDYTPAVIEKKWAEPLFLEGNEDSGWSFVDDLLLPENQLKFSQPERSEERIKREALTILAGMISHVDNQPGNQRLYCKKSVSETECPASETYFVIQDLGATMGGFRLSWDLRSAVTDNVQLGIGMNTWSRASGIFVKKNGCEVSVPSLSPNRTLGLNKDAKVSEAGRKFLLARFVALGGGEGTDLTPAVRTKLREQLTKVFTAGRNGELHQSTAWWVDTVMAKLDIVAAHKGC
ncbi:MAG: hypothetical protein V4655_05570 [Bdellovibrionota bacterium]